MRLTRWDPFRELEDMSSRLNRVLGRPDLPGSAEEGSMTVADWTPLVDIAETSEEFVIRAELPMVEKKDIKVTAKDGVLSIQGERKHEAESKGKKYHRIERSYGTFLRSFTIPEGVDEAKLMAEYKDGVLSVHLPKSPTAKPRSVEVKVS